VRIVCENCRTVYESSSHDVCPFCDHVTPPQARSSPREPPAPDPPAADAADPLQTMVFGPLGDRPAAGGGTPAVHVPVAALELTLAGDASVRHTVERQRTTIGRGLCDIRVSDPEVSREHCTIELRDGIAVLRDLGSANGTRVNGRVVETHTLADGDEIEIGTTRLRVRTVAAG
jgi:hypothetical protein